MWLLQHACKLLAAAYHEQVGTPRCYILGEFGGQQHTTNVDIDQEECIGRYTMCMRDDR